jgi:hypothetical protein
MNRAQSSMRDTKRPARPAQIIRVSKLKIPPDWFNQYNKSVE